MSWITRRVSRLARKVVGSGRLVARGERIVAGVSGGVDSLCMIHLLNAINQGDGHCWELQAVHVDPGFDGWSTARVTRACAAIGVPCTVLRTDVHGAAKQSGHDSCYACARERRKALFAFCDKQGSARLALAHILDDVNETFLMNLLFTSSARTILPVQPLFSGRLAIVRPLYYVDKGLVRRYARAVGIRAIRNRCPFGRSSSRSSVRRFLNRLYADDPRIRTNLFAGLHNLKVEYLPKPRHGKPRSVVERHRLPAVVSTPFGNSAPGGGS
ncbi:MAG TPA: tRNA 2-thiocytidine biosynthesis TtcA family protein [bacterium]|nr:tRNA 2-thiocytidine biosynthesis TtcA family protein [bacterium]